MLTTGHYFLYNFILLKYHIRAADYLNVTAASAATLTPIVKKQDRDAWVNYSIANTGWIKAGMKYANQNGTDDIIPMLWNLGENASVQEVVEPGPYTTVWQTYPANDASLWVNLRVESFLPAVRPKQVADKARRAVMTEFTLAGEDNSSNVPRNIVLQPIFKSFEDHAEIVAYLFISLNWDIFFQRILSDDSHPVVIVISNPCGMTFTFKVTGPEVEFLGYDDLHNNDYDEWSVTATFAESATFEEDKSVGEEDSDCYYNIQILPTAEMIDDYQTKLPLFFTIVVVAIFVLTSLAFVLYDNLVQHRQVKVATTTKKTTQIVQDLFPQEYRDRLFGSNFDDDTFMKKSKSRIHLRQNGHNKPSTFETAGASHEFEVYESAPIADFYPHCTVLQADIAGFTAWSSMRDPNVSPTRAVFTRYPYSLLTLQNFLNPQAVFTL